MLSLVHKTPEFLEALDHAFLSSYPGLVEFGMREKIPDRKERDDFTAQMTAEARNPDYHSYREMYTPL
jgi:hypothetical protein